METSKQINNWYNTFSKDQLKTGLNLRHYTILNHLIKSGLKKNSSVLEIGCGIGTLTGLIHKYLKKGKLVVADISDESIKIAKTRIPSSQKIDFIVTDMKDFDYPQPFDFIILPDVLEHIPIAQHPNLFKTLSKLMHPQSILLIHIPHPKAIEYTRKNTPEKLQIIDQSISANQLLKDAYANNLILISYKSYSIFNREAEDYALAKFRINSDTILTPLPKLVIIIRKFIERTKYFLARVLNIQL